MYGITRIDSRLISEFLTEKVIPLVILCRPFMCNTTTDKVFSSILIWEGYIYLFSTKVFKLPYLVNRINCYLSKG